MRQTSKQSGRTRRITFDALTGQLLRKALERRREIVVIVECERTPLVQRLQGDSVVARENMCDSTSHGLFDVVMTNVGLAV